MPEQIAVINNNEKLNHAWGYWSVFTVLASLWLVAFGFYQHFSYIFTLGISPNALQLINKDYETFVIANPGSFIIMLCVLSLFFTRFGEKFINKIPDSVNNGALLLTIVPAAFFVLVTIINGSIFQALLWLSPPVFGFWIMQACLSYEEARKLTKVIPICIVTGIFFSMILGVVNARVDINESPTKNRVIRTFSKTFIGKTADGKIKIYPFDSKTFIEFEKGKLQ